MNMFKKNGGFTLVELIVVIAIIAILAGIAVPAYSGYIGSANKAADTTALGAVKTAAMAALATEGEVVTITVNEKTSVVVNYMAGDTEKETTITTTGQVGAADFATFYTGSIANLELKTGDVATWDNSADADAETKGEWVITPSSTPAN